MIIQLTHKLRPAVTYSTIDHSNMLSEEIDHVVRSTVQPGLSLYALDEAQFRWHLSSLRPVEIADREALRDLFWAQMQTFACIYYSADHLVLYRADLLHNVDIAYVCTFPVCRYSNPVHTTNLMTNLNSSQHMYVDMAHEVARCAQSDTRV